MLRKETATTRRFSNTRQPHGDTIGVPLTFEHAAPLRVCNAALSTMISDSHRSESPGAAVATIRALSLQPSLRIDAAEVPAESTRAF
jgi:hypothetical protein